MTFGLNFPVWVKGQVTATWLDPPLGTQYWLQPGMEDVMQMDMPLTVTSRGTTVGTTTIPNTLNQLIVGTALNTPRSMAIAYDIVSIDGAAIHLTEIGTNTASAIQYF